MTLQHCALTHVVPNSDPFGSDPFGPPPGNDPFGPPKAKKSNPFGAPAAKKNPFGSDPFGSSESPVSPTRKLKGSLDAYAAKGDAKPKGRSGQSSFGNIKLGGKKQQPMPEGAPHAKPLGPGKSRCGRGNATM